MHSHRGRPRAAGRPTCRLAACSELEVERLLVLKDCVKENVVFVSDDADADDPGGIPPWVARVTAPVVGETLPPVVETSQKLEVILREEGAAMDVLDTPSAKQAPHDQGDAVERRGGDTLADVLRAAATSPVSRAPSPPEDDEVKPYASDNEQISLGVV